MDSLVQDRIYRRVALVDYQGACSDQNSPYSSAPVGTRPAALMSMLVGNIIKLGATWLALMPHRVVGWPHYGPNDNNYNDQDDPEDPTYAEDYEEEGTVVNPFEDTREIPLSPPVSYTITFFLNTFFKIHFV